MRLSFFGILAAVAVVVTVLSVTITQVHHGQQSAHPPAYANVVHDHGQLCLGWVDNAGYHEADCVSS